APVRAGGGTPPVGASRTTSAVAGPGVRVSASAIGMKAQGMAGHATRVVLTIEQAPFDDPEAAALVAASVLELDGRYGGDPGSGETPRPEHFVAPRGAFV